jgi:ABC-type polysaccharide/polyol phosphate export permease
MGIYRYLTFFGVDYFCLGRKFLVFNLVGRNLKVKYRRSVLGVLWTLLSPLAMALTYYLVFKMVMKVQIPHYVAFVLSGILPWSFFSQTVMEGVDSVAGNGALITKVPVPIQVFPLVGTLTNLVTLSFAVPILIGASLVTGVVLGPSVVLLVYYFLALFLFAYSLSVVFGILYVFFRDLKHLMGIGMQLWFYATPVIYSVEMVPARFRWIVYVNPVGTAFVALHRILSRGEWPSYPEVWVTAAWVVALSCVALGVYKLAAQDVAENI